MWRQKWPTLYVIIVTQKWPTQNHFFDGPKCLHARPRIVYTDRRGEWGGSLFSLRHKWPTRSGSLFLSAKSDPPEVGHFLSDKNVFFCQPKVTHPRWVTFCLIKMCFFCPPKVTHPRWVTFCLIKRCNKFNSTHRKEQNNNTNHEISCAKSGPLGVGHFPSHKENKGTAILHFRRNTEARQIINFRVHKVTHPRWVTFLL